jgi:hypothetical protein
MLTKLVPVEQRLAFYSRVFKWIVAFALWKYPKHLSNEAVASAKTCGIEIGVFSEAHNLLLIADSVGEISSIESLLSSKSTEFNISQHTDHHSINALSQSLSHTTLTPHKSHPHGDFRTPEAPRDRAVAGGSAQSATPGGSTAGSNRRGGGAGAPTSSPGMLPTSNRASPYLKSHTEYISPAHNQQSVAVPVAAVANKEVDHRVMKKMSAMRARTLVNAGVLPSSVLTMGVGNTSSLRNNRANSGGDSINNAGGGPASGRLSPEHQAMMSSLSSSGALGSLLGTSGSPARSGSPLGGGGDRLRGLHTFNPYVTEVTVRSSNTGPFAERQSKSAVASHQMIKRGKKV